MGRLGRARLEGSILPRSQHNRSSTGEGAVTTMKLFKYMNWASVVNEPKGIRLEENNRVTKTQGSTQ